MAKLFLNFFYFFLLLTNFFAQNKKSTPESVLVITPFCQQITKNKENNYAMKKTKSQKIAHYFASINYLSLQK
jgi:hypothetical protein